MTVTVVAMVTVAEDQAMALGRYMDATELLLKNAGAKIINRFEIAEVVVGTRPPKTVVIVEYPSREAVDLVFQSEDYKAVIPFRDKAFTSYDVSIVEQETPSRASTGS